MQEHNLGRERIPLFWTEALTEAGGGSKLLLSLCRAALGGPIAELQGVVPTGLRMTMAGLPAAPERSEERRALTR